MPAAEPSQPALPEIAGYKLIRMIGRGGMSTVYLARQTSLQREVALKVMLPDALTDEVQRRRFENEARTIARLDHPNIVNIYDVGRSADGLPYYAMPHLARGHLGQRQFSHDPEKVRQILRELLSALEYAHARGVVHRDVKAENVLFDDTDRPLLADFGIALRRGYGPRVTTAGLAVGSTAYMPPEQARGQNVDGRADLYSLGVLGWEMLTGRLPYIADDALSMALLHVQQPIPKLPRRLRHWQKFFDRALSKNADTRFHSAKQMRTVLERIPHHTLASGAGWKRPLAVVGTLATVTLSVLGLRHWQAAGDIRLPPLPVTPPPATTADATAPTAASENDSVSSLLRPLPESAAEPHITAAREQLQRRRWLTPRGDNAWESLAAAAVADPEHDQLPELTAQLQTALIRQVIRNVQRQRYDAAASDANHVRRLPSVLGLPPAARRSASAAAAKLDEDITKILHEQVEQAAKRYDRAMAMRAAAAAKQLQIGESDTAALVAISLKIPTPGQPLDDDPGWTLLRNDGGVSIAVARTPVTRADYARFARATGRPATRCRERASLLRIVAPRDWKSPGFEQNSRQPVVCVSWADANAYAAWLSKRQRGRHRLANADELRRLPTATGARPLSMWLDACGQNCNQRGASGRSWRDDAERRLLDPERGYDDVGFRLAREF